MSHFENTMAYQHVTNIKHLHDCTNKCTVQHAMFEHSAHIERTVKVTQHHERKISVNSQPVTQNFRHHQQMSATHCFCSISRTLRQITPRQKQLILPMLLSYIPQYSFSYVSQEPRAPHFDVTRSHTIRHTHIHPVEVPWKIDQPVAEASIWYHTTNTTDKHPFRQRFSHPQPQASSTAAHALDDAATAIGPAVRQIMLKHERKMSILII
jgi:hypothetical protein